MGEQLARKIEADFKDHVQSSAAWKRLEAGNGLTPTEATELSNTLAGGLLAGLKTLALAIVEEA